MSRFPQSLLEDPNVVEVAASMGMTPEQYLQSILDKPPSPILENLESGPRMDTGPTVATTPAPVLTPRVPGEGVIAAPVANPADAPTSYADMSPQDFQRMAQNPADVPAGAEFPGLGADFSGIERFDSAMEERTQAAREGIDQGVLQQQAASGDARALAELERRKNVPQGPALAQLEAENSQSPALQAPVDFATLEAQNSKSPVLINTTTPAPTTANTAAQTPALSTTSSTTATRAPALSRGAGNMTANARGSALGMIPRGESLIRIGGAMYSGALQGDGLGAATREYGSIQDANRKAEVDAYNKAEATRIAELRARGKGSKSDAKADAKAQAAANHAAIKLRDVDAALKGLDDYDGVVGIGYWFNKGWDLLTDNERATIRQKIARVKVDATLSNTAFTKGAISDREMRIFQSDQPGWMEGENAWRTYLNEYRDALLIMNSNLASGATPYAAANKSGTAAPSNTGSSNMSAADAIVGI